MEFSSISPPDIGDHSQRPFSPSQLLPLHSHPVTSSIQPPSKKSTSTSFQEPDHELSLANWLQGTSGRAAASTRISGHTDTLNREDAMSHADSADSSSSVFDDPNRLVTDEYEDENRQYNVEDYTDPTQLTSREPSGEEAQTSYDLKAPPPSVPLNNVELLSERLFSIDHLKYLLRDNANFSRFQSFLKKYRPESNQLLQRYLETQKAISAIEYANAIASQISRGPAVAKIDREFEGRARLALEAMADDALPGYVTHRLVQIVTEALVKEIIGQNTPIMREMVRGLAEIYCLTDPSLPDNPIVYASEEFFRCTQYGRDYTIGRNCRFLQGPRTSHSAVQRLIDALGEGTEVCETILNYRRDGSPFINLLMIAPLYDNKGNVRYFIGAQIDVNGLIEGGHGLDSFEKLLRQDRTNQRYGGAPPKTPEAALSELSMMMDPDEVESIRHGGRERRTSDASSQPGKGPGGRRYLGMDGPDDRDLWPAPHLGSSGRLPGVFQNYLLVRPYPSLRITFTSPALRIPGLLQSKLLDRIAGPAHIRDGILSALSSGFGVTAKINWLSTSTPSNPNAPHDPPRSQHSSGPGSSRQQPPAPQQQPGQGFEGKPRWIHCTPLMGSDEKVGVWMIVMVESESITGALNAHERAVEANAHVTASMQRERMGLQQQYGQRAPSGVMSPKYKDGQKMYKEYLRREGRLDSMQDSPNVNGNGPSSPRISGGVGGGGGGYQGSQRTPASTPGSQPPFSTPQSAVGSVRSRTDEKTAKARLIAERAMAGEDQFRDF